MGKFDEMSKYILDNIGGVGNITNVTHCATRLRIEVAKPSPVYSVPMVWTKEPSCCWNIFPPCEDGFLMWGVERASSAPLCVPCAPNWRSRCATSMH